jgi:hypothetical protein
MILALAAYAAYVINAAQFLLKLRAARLQASGSSGGGGMTIMRPRPPPPDAATRPFSRSAASTRCSAA